jgi:hypothetical protein
MQAGGGGIVHTVTERVQRGAALLDEKRPGWWQQIDLDDLNLRDGCTCIGGQLCARKTGTEEDYLIFMDELGLSRADEVRHGFDRAGDDSDYDALTAAWRDLITKRREDVGVPA